MTQKPAVIVTLGVALVAVRLGTPTWGPWDYIVLVGVILVGAFVTAIGTCMILSIAELGCPTKAWLGARLGYTYDQSSDYECRRWVKRDGGAP